MQTAKYFPLITGGKKADADEIVSDGMGNSRISGIETHGNLFTAIVSFSVIHIKGVED